MVGDSHRGGHWTRRRDGRDLGRLFQGPPDGLGLRRAHAGGGGHILRHGGGHGADGPAGSLGSGGFPRRLGHTDERRRGDWRARGRRPVPEDAPGKPQEAIRLHDPGSGTIHGVERVVLVPWMRYQMNRPRLKSKSHRPRLTGTELECEGSMRLATWMAC